MVCGCPTGSPVARLGTRAQSPCSALRRAGRSSRLQGSGSRCSRDSSPRAGDGSTPPDRCGSSGLQTRKIGGIELWPGSSCALDLYKLG